MISHKHRSLFIHIPKCGGQSVEHVFLRDHGFTWETREPLLLRANDSSHGPPRLAHLTWQEYVNLGYISATLMREYTTFTVVRDPYKRVESLYRCLGYDASISFAKFVLDVLTPQLREKGVQYWFIRPQYEYVCDIAGTISVEHVIKLEHINEQLPPLLVDLGISKPEVPHVNKAKKRGVFGRLRTRLEHARQGIYTYSPFVPRGVVWTPDTRAAVRSLYQRDFEAFDY